MLLICDLQVFTWGHRLVTPRRVIISRNLKKYGSNLLKFHHKERLHVVAVAAGMVHSLALTDDGALFYWISSDPDLRCQQVFFKVILIPFGAVSHLETLNIQNYHFLFCSYIHWVAEQ